MLITCNSNTAQEHAAAGLRTFTSAAHHFQSGGTLQSESYEHTNQGKVLLEVWHI